MVNSLVDILGLGLLLLSWAIWQFMGIWQWIILTSEPILSSVTFLHMCYSGLSNLLPWSITPSNLLSMQQSDLSEIQVWSAQSHV